MKHDCVSSFDAGIEGGCAELDARLTQFAPIVDAEIIAPQVAKYRPQVEEALTTTRELAQPYWEKAKPHVEKVIIAGEPIVRKRPVSQVVSPRP